ncbi:hypothetical protein C4587_02835 [Candidatus Parcubacteria bacterium]|nr:MAG: hypothetical protein C4587_02835 [Candidatus Parcubacteria bacterium]
MPRPACLDATPRCLLPEPAEGWCPAPPALPPVQTPKEVPSAPQLRCGNKAALRERVACRLGLSETELRTELEIQYLPEECRALGADSRQSCVAQYRAFQPCWQMPLGPGRVACGRQVLKLGPVISEEVKICRGKTGTEQAICKADLRERVFSMIKFRFYELEERAEEILENAENKKPLEDFQVLIETKKQEFNAAGSKEERRQIILDVRSGWQKFVEEAREALSEGAPS